jgi:FkbM family methyltransferase
VERSGFLLELDPTDYVDKWLYICGAYELADYSEFVGAAGRGDVVFDVGAHIGTYTLGLCRAVGDAGQVHAFEPNPQTFRRLRRNIELNGFANAQLNQVALADTAGQAQLNSPLYLNTGGGSLVPHQTQHGLPTHAYEVQVTSLDQYCYTNEIRGLSLIKIDAQGYELRILRGAETVIRRRHPRIMVEHDPYWLSRAGSSGQELCSELRRLGYSLFQLKRRSLVPASPAEDELVNLHCI